MKELCHKLLPMRVLAMEGLVRARTMEISAVTEVS